ncbi:polysaccharide biosynthesis/export family protein [Gracilimonas mengyeensis]|nr:polysaccharide biosynthesis/export family protein [Gracilimonas mengyeensis]
MNSYKALFPFLLVIAFLCTPFQVSAQDDGGSRQTPTNYDLDFGPAIDIQYYQDALSPFLGANPLSFSEEININSYTLGPDDLITVTIQGNQTVVLRALLVNPQGDIVLPMLGSIHVDNQTIAEAQKTISDAAKDVFKDPTATVTLEKAKALKVHVNGAVPQPGKHIIAPFSRVDAAVFSGVYDIQEAGSSTESDNVIALRPITNTVRLLEADNLSLRNIRIIHSDGSTSQADLYAYFKAGKLSANPVVQNGDRIIVNNVTRDTPRIGVSGAVMNAYELEYTDSDTPALLLEMTGGFRPDADTSKVFVFRYQNGSTNKIEVPRSEWPEFELMPNDRLIVPTNKSNNNSASAWVHGEVSNPGNYPIRNGETSALQLIQISGDLTDRALPSAAYLSRGSIENEIPNQFNTDILKRTSDQLAQGFEYLDLETRLSQNKVHIDLTDEEQLSKVKIYDGDRLYVPRDEATIFVFGQVNNPGYYPFTGIEQDPMDYIQRAGGFALSANKDRIFIIKAGSGTWYRPDETELASGDRIFIDRVPYDELNAQRTYEVQRQQIKNTRIQLIMTGLSTITGIITTYLAIQRN